MSALDQKQNTENVLANEPAAVELLITLTPKELETLYYLSNGLNEKMIMEKMFLGQKSIYKFVSSLKEKLNQNSLIPLAQYSYEHRATIKNAYLFMMDKKKKK